MTKELSIAARDHGAGVPQERLDGVAGGRRLPVVAAEMVDVKNDLGDFLLRRAGAIAVEGAQHPALAGALLTCQSRVGRNGAAVQGREKSIDRFDPVEAVYAEGYGGDSNRLPVIGAVDDLETLPVSESKAKRCVIFAHRRIAAPWLGGSTCETSVEVRRGLGQYDDARVFLREPENGSVRRRCQGVDGEIVTPTAAEFAR